MNEEKYYAIIAASMLAFPLVGLLTGFCMARCIDLYQHSRLPDTIVRDTEFVPLPPIHDTIWLKGRDIVRIERVTLPAAAPVPERDTVSAPAVADSPAVLPDSASVLLPIERATFAGENYEAVVEGWRPRLVDIKISPPPAMVITQTQTRTVRKHWGVTIGPQVGYGITPEGWQPYAGVGVTVGFSF